MRRLLAGLVILAWLNPLRLVAQVVPDGVRQEGNRLFARWQADAHENRDQFLKLHGLDAQEVDLNDAVLQSPYVIYRMGPREVVEFAKDPGRDILSFGELFGWVFPMTVGERVTGAVVVGEDRGIEGGTSAEEQTRFVSRGGHEADDYRDKRVLELSREYTERKGYVLVCLNIYPLGGFILVRQENVTMFVTPFTALGGSVLGLEEGSTRGRYAVLAWDEALPLMADAARRFTATTMER